MCQSNVQRNPALGSTEVIWMDHAFVKQEAFITEENYCFGVFYNILVEASKWSLWGNSPTSWDKWHKDCEGIKPLVRLKGGSPICIRTPENVKICTDSGGTTLGFTQWRESSKGSSRWRRTTTSLSSLGLKSQNIYLVPFFFYTSRQCTHLVNNLTKIFKLSL